MSVELRSAIDARRRIYLVRHGDVSYFDSTGRPLPPLTVSLNEEGIRQAMALRDALAGVALDRVVSSGLPRTDHTAEVIARGRGIEIEKQSDLREVAPGPLLDTSEPAFERSFTGALSEGIGPGTRFLGGETFGSLQARVLAAFGRLVASPGWRDLLIVAHGGTNRVLLLHALGAGLRSLGRLEQEAGCLNLIDVAADGALLVRLVNHAPGVTLSARPRATTMESIYLGHRDAAGARGPRSG